MALARQFWFINSGANSHLKTIIPIVSGCIMLVSSVLPWIIDPLLGNVSAWKLAVDIGWQVRTGVFSYGLLCFLFALYTFLVALASVKTFKGSTLFADKYILASILCMAPILLFLLQYLFTDVIGINTLAQHKIQMLLIQGHFGYSGQPDRITINPYTFTASTILGRLLLLTDQVSLGILLPLLAAALLFEYRRVTSVPLYISEKTVRGKNIWLAAIGLCLVLALGRGPAATICDFAASQSLSSGNYGKALGWLDWAEALNPSLLQVASSHIERGEALYFLNPNQSTEDTRVYLASSYRSQNDFLDAYQELLAVWQAHPTTPWVLGEMDTTLQSLSEFSKSLNGSLSLRAAHDDTALVWLQLLTKVDHANLYGQYLSGLIMYDQHDYAACTTQMKLVLATKPNADVSSSAITYIALSDMRQGNYIEGRLLLFQAIKLDPGYINNTAREALSGLY